LGIGDFRLSPYRIYSPKCISSRIKEASFATRSIDPCNVIVAEGPPITRPERTFIDPSLDSEGSSFIENAFYDVKAKGINVGRIETTLNVLEMAVKAAAKDSPFDTGRVISRRTESRNRV